MTRTERTELNDYYLLSTVGGRIYAVYYFLGATIVAV